MSGNMENRVELEPSHAQVENPQSSSKTVPSHRHRQDSPPQGV